MDTVGGAALGVIALIASFSSRSGPMPRTSSGSASAYRGSSETARRLFERLVLQQPREQQVAGLQQGEVLFVLHLGGGQQPRGLQVEQGRGHHQELAGLVERPVVTHGADVGDELVGDPAQRHLGDVELVLADELQQQVERAGEVGQPHGETGRRRGVGRQGIGRDRSLDDDG
jgi:hypothetical protein